MNNPGKVLKVVSIIMIIFAAIAAAADRAGIFLEEV